MSAEALALAAVVATSAIVGCVIFVELVLARWPPGWDEAAHALQGALIAHDIRAGDLPGLLFDTYRQVYWPPMHSWLVGIPFLVTGPSLVVARAVSVAAFVLLAPTVYLVARTIEPRRGILAGSLAAGFALSSPGLVALSAASLLELPGLLALSCTMLVYCRLERDPEASPSRHALLGVSTVIVYLVKTNYGVLLVLCIALSKLLEAGFRPRRLLTKPNLYALLPLVLFCVIWFAWPQKIAWTWSALVNEPYGGEQAQGLSGLFFYPRAIIEMAGSIWVLLWAGIALSWRARREPGIGFLLVLALTQFAIGEVHHTKVDRHIVPLFPPMFVLTGVAGARVWDWLRTHGSVNRTVVAGFLVGAIAGLQVSCFEIRKPRPVVQTPPRTVARSGLNVVRYVSFQAREQTPVLVLIMTQSWPNPPVVDWYYVSRGLVPVTSAGRAMDPPLERQLAVTIENSRLPQGLRTTARRVLGRYDAPSTRRTLTLRIWDPAEAGEWAGLVEATIRVDPPRTIIALVPASDETPHRFGLIEPGLVRSGYAPVSAREFPDAEMRVHVYRRQ